MHGHGIRTMEVATSVSTPVVAGSGICFAVGTAPVHSVNGKVNVPIMAQNFSEAVTLGYSEDWEKYSLCEVMDSHFKLYGIGPVIFVNVLDPKKHKKVVPATEMIIKDKKVALPFEAIKDSLEVKDDAGTKTYKIGVDYEAFYDNGSLVVEVLEGSAITSQKLKVGYSAVDPSMVTDADIIGGFNVSTKETTGFELIDKVFPMFGIKPDLLICPRWSHKPEIAAVMSAKAQGINGIFKAKALIDVDTKTVKHYADVPVWKKAQNINSKSQVLCFPKGKLGNKIYHLSTQMAGLMARVDAKNGCPCESPSNKSLQINSTVLEDGTEVALDLQQANFLNASGVVTAINFVGGFVLWGNESACFPYETDVKDYFICVSRMFEWVASSVTLSYWKKLDGKFTRRLVDSIVDGLNIWLNGLTSEEKLLGGRIEFKEEENTTAALMAGKAVFHIYMTPPSPAKELEFILEYDTAYIKAALV